MKIGIMQPYFFPYIGYWQLINTVDKFVILDDVNFIKRGWIHRNNIIAQGRPEQINVCIEKSSRNKLIRELSLSEEHNWKIKLIRKIKHTYSKAPYYHDVEKLVSDIILTDARNLSSFLFNSICNIAELLDIRAELVPSSSIYPKGELKGQERIIDICVREGADVYINPIGGKLLYNKDRFRESNLELNFIQMNDDNPSSSILDVLMKNTLQDISLMMERYKLC
jgi:hypothetical protein